MHLPFRATEAIEGERGRKAALGFDLHSRSIMGGGKGSGGQVHDIIPYPLPWGVDPGDRGVESDPFSVLVSGPLFHHLGPPKIVITSSFGSKAIPF